MRRIAETIDPVRQLGRDTTAEGEGGKFLRQQCELKLHLLQFGPCFLELSRIERGIRDEIFLLRDCCIECFHFTRVTREEERLFRIGREERILLDELLRAANTCQDRALFTE